MQVFAKDTPLAAAAASSAKAGSSKDSPASGEHASPPEASATQIPAYDTRIR